MPGRKPSTHYKSVTCLLSPPSFGLSNVGTPVYGGNVTDTATTHDLEFYRRELTGYCYRMLGSAFEADDAVQETMLRAWKAADGFEGRSSLRSWLYRIATNECLSYLEQQKRKSTASLDETESGLSNKVIADKYFDPNKLEWKLQLAIQQLPEKQRVVFTLRYYDEMPYEEMSRVLDTSEGALKASYHHAVKKIEDYILNR